MPTRIEIWWKDRLAGTVLSPWDPCEAVCSAESEGVAAFAESPGEFGAEPGVQAGREWYRGLRVEEQWVEGTELRIGDVDLV
ncbi:MAG: hypothetical protein L0Z62_03880 [Gemmataceae bacterium]|nr:hypothetical protein [Gemmataceae bacterium]